MALKHKNKNLLKLNSLLFEKVKIKKIRDSSEWVLALLFSPWRMRIYIKY
jgi:hypothetical protein